MSDMIDLIIKKAGGATELARKLDITRPAVLHWKARGYKVPPIKHAFKIENITGIPKEEIWTDYFNSKPQNITNDGLEG